MLRDSQQGIKNIELATYHNQSVKIEESWLISFLKKEGYQPLEIFLNEYTFDDAAWINDRYLYTTNGGINCGSN